MDPLNLIFSFLAGFFICFAIPHLNTGLQGKIWSGPFASSAPLNFILGSLSLMIALYLLAVRRFFFDFNVCTILFWVAFLLTGFWLSSRRES